MTEKPLSSHTDASGIVESLRAAGDGRPFLGDMAVVDGLVRGLAGDVLTRYDEVGLSVLTPEDAANADREQCMKLAAVFTGADPAYAPVRQWTGTPLADHLRQRMEHQLQPDDNDQALVAQAFAVFVHSLYDLLREAGPVDELQETLQAGVRSFTMALMGVTGND